MAIGAALVGGMLVIVIVGKGVGVAVGGREVNVGVSVGAGVVVGNGVNVGGAVELGNVG